MEVVPLVEGEGPVKEREGRGAFQFKAIRQGRTYCFE